MTGWQTMTLGEHVALCFGIFVSLALLYVAFYMLYWDWKQSPILAEEDRRAKEEDEQRWLRNTKRAKHN